jgi:hypothetical protein
MFDLNILKAPYLRLSSAPVIWRERLNARNMYYYRSPYLFSLGAQHSSTHRADPVENLEQSDQR